MNSHRTPFSGKTQTSLKLKPWLRNKESSKSISKDPQNSRKNRVFGTVRNANIPIKSETQKPIIIPSIAVSQKQTKNKPATRSPTNDVAEKKSLTCPKHNSNNEENLSLREPVKRNNAQLVSPRTPMASPSIAKLKISGTPYKSAHTCSKCRFDKLETSSYWLTQIKLSETVGKHFVSATFFQLASECNAEPIRKMRLELKRYLARHERLNREKEWREVSVSYGLMEDDEKEKGGSGSERKEFCTTESTTQSGFDEEEAKNEEHQFVEQQEIERI